MTFSPDQKKELGAPLSRDDVKTRKQGGRNVSYIEAWHAIAEANRIFGFDGWTRETVHFECIDQHECVIGKTETSPGYPGWNVTYICKARINAGEVVREGCGGGHGIDRDLGQAHESAIKEAESDAMKRAMMTFGNPFGLALYDKTQANVETPQAARSDDPIGSGVQMTPDEFEVSRQKYLAYCRTKIASFPDGDRAVLHWWATDQEYKARRDYELKPAEVIELKGLVSAKAKLETK